MIYFDNAATSYPKPECVLDAMRDYSCNIGANAGRAAYRNSILASKLVFETRESVAQLIHAVDSSRIVFTQNATEALNLAILGLMLEEGDHVITTSIEHNSVMRPLRHLETTRKVILDIVRCSNRGELNIKDMESKVSRKTKLIVFNHASNVVGTIMPLNEICVLSERHNIPLLVDAAQTIGNLSLNVQEDHIKLLAFSGHKGLLGPMGIGCLYIDKSVDLQPLKYGGTGSHSEHETQPDFLPDKFESGTMNLPAIAGLKAGIEYINTRGILNLKKSLHDLTEILIDRLSRMKKVYIHGLKTSEDRTSVVSISVEDREPSEIGDLLDKKYEIAVRIGLHCSPQTHRTIGTFPKGTIRISMGIFNTLEHVERLCEALCQITGS